MVKACRKTKSKRVTLRKKYKVVKKVKEHHRKLRKEMKTNPKKFKRKDPGVPHSLPFKDEVMKHVEETKQKFEVIRRAQFVEAIKLKTRKDDLNIKVPSKAHSNLAGEFRKVIQESDVILMVVDARDPLGTRCARVEEEVLSHRKKLVVILNKIDLVPTDNVKQWLNYFRQSHPTLPFKANTQEQLNNLGNSKLSWKHQLGLTEKSVKCSLGLGVDGLMALLGNYARGRSGTRLTVGVVGLPNTGKSAIVNTLKRKRVTTSSNVPGQTKQAQLFQLDKQIYLYDSPGIVMAGGGGGQDECDLVLKNCVKPESLEDPHPAVEAILRRVPKQQLIVKYGIRDYTSVTDFLLQLALRTGKLKKGGVANTRQAARQLLHDWISGRITYHTLPPETGAAKVPDDAADIPLLQSFDEATLRAVPARDMSNTAFCPDAVLTTSLTLSVDGLTDGMGESSADEDEDDQLMND